MLGSKITQKAPKDKSVEKSPGKQSQENTDPFCFAGSGQKRNGFPTLPIKKNLNLLFLWELKNIRWKKTFLNLWKWLCVCSYRCGLEVPEWELEEHVYLLHYPYSCPVCPHRYSVKIGMWPFYLPTPPLPSHSWQSYLFINRLHSFTNLEFIAVIPSF